MAADLFSDESIQNIFVTKTPKNRSIEDRLDAVTGTMIITAKMLATECPPCAERTLALRHLEKCNFYAKASIARNQDVLSPDPVPDPDPS